MEILLVFLQVCCFCFVRSTPFTRDDCIWIQYNNTGITHGTNKNFNTLKDCQQFCKSETSCLGLDWDPQKDNGSKCWTLQTTYMKVDHANVDHYDLICPSELLVKHYVGCYELNQSTESPAVNSSSMTVSVCTESCRMMNSTFAAIQGGQSCSCFKSLDTNFSSKECNVACSGNQSEFCGGRDSMYSVYTVCPAGFYGIECNSPCHCSQQTPCNLNSGECPDSRCSGNWTGTACNISKISDMYIGCYGDGNNNRQLSTMQTDREDNTVAACSFTCTQQNYAYFGLEYYKQCFCVNEYNKEITRNEDGCNATCPGNSSEICGGADFISLYATCPAGNHGKNCTENCNCINNERCSYSNGTCPSGGCKLGWSGSSCSIRDCTTSNGDCGDKLSCVPLELKNVFVNRCTCPDGYHRKELWKDECTDIDECLLDRHVCNTTNIKCNNTDGSYECICLKGYTKNNSQDCSDVNECETGEAVCDNSSSICINTDGDYLCTCIDGYENESDKLCKDKDECSNGESKCDSVSTKCINEIGDYNCICNKGFESINRTVCYDIEDCLNETICNNATSTCNNTNGGYTCVCLTGYFKIDDLTCSNTPMSASEKLPVDVIIGATFGAFAGLLIILLIVFLLLHFKRRGSETKYEKPVEMKEESMGHLVTVGKNLCAVQNVCLPDKIRQQLSQEDKMRKEFEEIPLKNGEFCELGMDKDLKKKNRFKNIIPYESNQVILSQEDDDYKSRYINASYIQGCNDSDKFIATQGPRPDTMNEFWRMVLEKDVNLIVMMTSVVEGNKGKCDQYWPTSGQSVVYGGITVKSRSEDSWTSYTLRHFEASMHSKSIEVDQLQYTDWRDHSVPSDINDLLRFRRIVRRHMLPDKYAVVHCSAGAGRTGTFIAIDYLLEQEKSTQDVNIFNCVKQLRTERASMVQNLAQYKFIHAALLVEFTIGNTAVGEENFPLKYKELQREQEKSGRTSLEMQFQHLEETSLDPEETDNNQVISNVIPRIQLVDAKAVYVNSWKFKDVYVAVKMFESSADFWKLCREKGCKVILYVDHKQDTDFEFVPTKDNPMNIGDENILLESSSKELYGTRYQLRADMTNPLQSVYENSQTVTDNYGNVNLTNTSQEVISSDDNIYENSGGILSSQLSQTSVFHVRHTTIKSSENIASLLMLYESIRALKSTPKSPVVFTYNSNDCSAVGFCLAVFNALEMITNEHEIDIYQIVLNIRKSRPELFCSLSSYMDLHDVIERYLTTN